MADPLRARIVELLADERLCTCHLAEPTGTSSSNLFNHLRVLRTAGVVQPEPVGRFTYYRLRPEALDGPVAHYRTLTERARGTAAVKRPCG